MQRTNNAGQPAGIRDPTRRAVMLRANTEIRAQEGSEGNQRFELSFSSETPYQRYSWMREEYYDEILVHDASSVDLSRLKNIGVVLYNHDRNSVIGRVVSVGIKDKRGIAEIEFDADEQSQIIADKVRAGTLKGVSVAYTVDATDYVKVKGVKSKLYVRHWTPLEISIVSIPADTSVGVGRNFNHFGGNGNMDGIDITMPVTEQGERGEGTTPTAPETPTTPTQTPTAPPTAAPERSAEELIRQERQRVSEISALCREFNVDAERFIADGSTVDEVRSAIIEQLRQQRPAVPNVQVTRDEADKFRAAASDALLMRGGIQIAQPAEGARDLRGLGLREMMIECAVRDNMPGANALYRKNSQMLFDELMQSRAYYNPSSSFPSIMDETINKAYIQGYQLTPTTFETWTQRGTLSDFKRTQAQWRRGDAGELLLVPEGGELKNDVPTDERRGGRELKTYGRQFSMTREAFINDDIGFLTSLPARYAQSTKLTLNRQVYQILANNPTLEDAKTLFHADHGNLAATAGALNLANLVAAMEAMTTQRNARNQIIQVRPQFLVVPTGLGAYARMLLGSPTIKTTALSSSATEMQLSNPVAGALQVVEDPELLAQLGNNSKYSWFLVANSATVDGIQVDYLNGVDTPTIRRMETPGQLGFVWDIYMDWGISVLDWRGLYKNGGAAPTAL